MRVAAIQMVSGKDKSSNLIQAENLIAQAAEQGAEFILLPENFAVFSSKSLMVEAESSASGQYQIRHFLSRLSALHCVFLVAGSLPMADESESGKLPSPGKVYTSTLVYSPMGEQVARYDKLHLFDVEVGDSQGSYRESDQFEAGDKAVVVELPQCSVGLSICYDLRFPELYRRLFEMGATVMLVPAAFTAATGEAHWMTLLRARAIENQCFIIAANQGGQHSAARQTWGHSCIVSPWGEVMAVLESGPGLVVADLDFSELERRRHMMPVAQHRRKDIL